MNFNTNNTNKKKYRIVKKGIVKTAQKGIDEKKLIFYVYSMDILLQKHICLCMQHQRAVAHMTSAT
jgi:hypothetical protein